MSRIFIKLLIGILFLFGIMLIPTFKADAVLNVHVEANYSSSSITVPYGTNVIINWWVDETSGVTCSNNFGGSGTTSGYYEYTATGDYTFTVTCHRPDPFYYKLQRCTDGMIFETGPFPDGTYDTGGEILVGSEEYSSYNYIVIGSSTSSYPDSNHNIPTTRSGLYSCPASGGGGGGGGGGTGSCVYPYGEPPYTEYCSQYTDSYNCEQGGHDCTWTYN